MQHKNLGSNSGTSRNGTMKRTVYMFGLLIFAGVLAGVATAQEDSLADAARLHKRQQQGKPVATKVFTNDNLPTTETISTVGAPPADTPPANVATDTPSDTNPAPPKDGASPDAKPGAQAKQQKKTWKNWRDKIQQQKQAVEQMQKDTAELEKQYRLASLMAYSNAAEHGNKSAQTDGDDAVYREQMEQKKKALEESKQKIDDLQEEARRAGVPSGFRD